ncbi:hypothetical protein OHA85_02395 [Nocardia salmonicida]|nr:hypothetical protein [Nocardia salmonicida]
MLTRSPAAVSAAIFGQSGKILRDGQRRRGQDFHMPPEHQRRRVRPGAHQTQQARRDAFRSSRRAGASRCRTRQLPQMGGAVVVEREHPGQRRHDLIGRMPVAALLEPDVVIGAHPDQ